MIRRRAFPRNAKIAVTAGEVVLFVRRWSLVVPAAGSEGELIKKIVQTLEREAATDVKKEKGTGGRDGK
jgi:hypothetical protein